jgi:hypothetical protein
MKKKKKTAGKASKSEKRSPPLKIPLPFDAAVSGLLAVKPDPKPAKPDSK